MKGDMNIPPIPQTTPSSLRPGLVGGEVLKLLQPAEGLIRPGQSAQAEVISLKQNDLAFQLLLKLTLAGGRETNVQASSNSPSAIIWRIAAAFCGNCLPERHSKGCSVSKKFHSGAACWSRANCVSVKRRPSADSASRIPSVQRINVSPGCNSTLIDS